MFLKTVEINNKSLVADIVAQDYRTVDVFRRHGIGYCCGGKWPLDIACEMQGVDAEKVRLELETATRTIQVSNRLDFTEWDVDFMIDYIINVHHRYLKVTLPETQQVLADFSKEHLKKFSWLADLELQFDLLIKQLMSAARQEEEVLFPYIRQIAHAHQSREPYAALLIRTLRKPVEDNMFKSHKTIAGIIMSIRDITNSYSTAENVCTSHKVVIAKLKELDIDISQHFYLEQSILFPRAIAIEKEVLGA